ncbi:MAG: hypothetical protein V4581_16615 [Bacteroidota bacterium]
MKIKVLVYDSEIGYYLLLKNNILKGFEFVLYTKAEDSMGYDAVAFFLNNKIEAIDMLRLYDESKPFVLGANNGHSYVQHRDNAYIINIALPHNKIVACFKTLFNELLLLCKKEKAL